MEMSQIRHFLALADTGTVGRAAQSIGVSQPALSKSIRRLETELHVRLFDRTPRGSALTRYGKAFLQHARTIALATHNAETSIRAMRGAGPEDLVLGVSPSVACTVLPLASAALVKETPGLRVHVVTGMVDELLARVSAGGIEFAVMAAPEHAASEGLEQELLISTELELVARRGHPLLEHKRLRLEDLLAYPWILPSGAASGRQALYRSFAALGLPLPVPRIESDSITYIASFLQDGDYLSFLPLSLVSAQAGMPELSRLRVEGQHWRRPLVATYRKGTELSTSSRQLVAHIQREVMKLEADTWALRSVAPA